MMFSVVAVVQSLNHVQLFAAPWTAAHQAPLLFNVSGSLPKFMSIERVMPSNHLTLCHPILLLPSIFPSIRVFSNESTLPIRWPKYWSFSISPSNEYSGLISFRILPGDFKSQMWDGTQASASLQPPHDAIGQTLRVPVNSFQALTF